MYIIVTMMNGTSHKAKRAIVSLSRAEALGFGSVGTDRVSVRIMVSGLRWRVVYRASTCFIISSSTLLCSIRKVSTVFFVTKIVSMRCDGVATVSVSTTFSKHCGQRLSRCAMRFSQLHADSKTIACNIKNIFFFIFFLCSLFFLCNFASLNFNENRCEK